MSRYFTLDEAEELLPSIEKQLRQAQSTHAEVQEAEGLVRLQKQKVAMAGGSVVNVNRAFALRDQRQHALERFKRSVESITETGCQIKDLDQGLIDFPALYGGGEVLLCWKLGEGNRILFWHGVDEGFAGRKEIDEEFRRKHRGGHTV